MTILGGMCHLQVLFEVTFKTDYFLGLSKFLVFCGGIVRIGVKTFCYTDSCFYLILQLYFCCASVKKELLLET